MIRLTALAMLAALAAPAPAQTGKHFGLRIIDEATGRGVPLVELKTTSNVRYYTDSAGWAAIDEPGLWGQRVFFHVWSHGYEFPKDGFGIPGRAVELQPGGEATWKIKRLNIAERLYRVTGGGIYRDSILLGKPTPLREPLLNGQVFGQDSVQSIIYRNKIFYFWGDTSRPSYPLGHFGTAGATADLPGLGGLDPNDGVNLSYFVGKDGFSRPVCDVPGKGLKWIDGLMLLKDDSGKERLVGRYQIMKSLGEMLERGLMIWDDEKNSFVLLKKLDRDGILSPEGHPIRHTDDGTDYYYFPTPFPTSRVRADFHAIQDPARYEAYTCLAPGAHFDGPDTKIQRDADGNAVWSWKPDTAPLNFERERDLIKAGILKESEARFRWNDPETHKPVFAHAGSVNWNPHRNRWVMIAVQSFGGPSFLGEVWYAEADRLEGPWLHAKKIVTHDKYSFYNPKHHPFYDQQNGRIIYFEGTYSQTFSRDADPTPRYDYNQIMYRLDLDGPRLSLPPRN